MRKYDLQQVRERELNQLNLTITTVKDNWQQIRAYQQERMRFIEQKKQKHNQDSETYRDYQEYLAPTMLKKKLQYQIKDFIR